MTLHTDSRSSASTGAVPLGGTTLVNLLERRKLQAIRVFSIGVVPWLAQTPAYAQEVVNGAVGLATEVRPERVAHRMALQDMVSGVPVHLIVDHTLVADLPALHCIQRCLALGHYTVQLLPETGVPERYNGSFTLLDFRDVTVLMYDALLGTEIDQREESVDLMSRTFAQLVKGAMTPVVTRRYLNTS
jgi:hypothetical protein